MKKILAIALLTLLMGKAHGQSLSAGVEVAPKFEQQTMRLRSNGIGAVLSYGIEGCQLQAYVSETNLEVGGYFGVKNIAFGLFASTRIDQPVQIKPMMAIRYTHEVANGFRLQVGIKGEMATNKDILYEVCPLFISVQKKFIYGKEKNKKKESRPFFDGRQY